MVRKFVSSNTTYVLIAAVLVILGQLLYLDASARVAEMRAGEEKIVNEEVSSPNGAIQDDTQLGNALSAINSLPSESDDTGVDIPSEPQESVTDNTLPTQEEAIETTPENTEEVGNVIELPFESIAFINGSEWVKGYGGMRYLGNALEIGGDDRYSASLVLLDGGFELADYTFTVRTDWNRGSSFSLITRFEDFDNFVSCSFVDYGAQASIVAQENGKRISYNTSPTLKTKSVEAWKDLTFGVRVSGNTLECLKEGEVVLRNTFKKIPEKGTAAIGLWSQYPGEGLVTVYQTSVKGN